MLAKTTALITLLSILAATNAQPFDNLYARDAEAGVPQGLKDVFNGVKNVGKNYAQGFGQGISRRDLELVRRVAEAEAEAAKAGDVINKIAGGIAKAEGTMGGAFVKGLTGRDLAERGVNAGQVATGIEKAIGTGLGKVVKLLRKRAAEAGMEAEEYVDVLYGRDADPEYDDLFDVYARDAEADFDDLYAREAKIQMPGIDINRLRPNIMQGPIAAREAKIPVGTLDITKLQRKARQENAIAAREARGPPPKPAGKPIDWNKFAPAINAGVGAAAQAVAPPPQKRDPEARGPPPKPVGKPIDWNKFAPAINAGAGAAAQAVAPPPRKRDAEADPEIFDYE